MLGRQRRLAPPSDVAKMPVSKRAKKVSLTKVKKKAPSAGCDVSAAPAPVTWMTSVASEGGVT